MASNRRGRQHTLTRELVAAINDAMDAKGVDDYQLAEDVGVNRTTIQRIRGMLNQASPHIPRICKALGIDYDSELGALRGFRVSSNIPKKIPIIGYVGAGDLYSWEPDKGPWVGFDFIDPPPGSGPGLGAVIVRGASMGDVYRDRDVLFFHKGEHPEETFLGEDCVVQVRGGSAFIKKVVRGSKPRRHTLLSYGKHPPMENVDIEWAAPIVHITRGKGVRK